MQAGILIGFGALVAVILVSGIWVRVAPIETEEWHVDPRTGASGLNSFATRVEVAVSHIAAYDQISQIALATPRTRILAESKAERRISFVTRSKLWGFPDMTSVFVEPTDKGSTVHIYGRAKFGIGDGGVNKARINKWITRLND